MAIEDSAIARTDRRRPRAVLTLALLTTFLLPFSVLPYLATRRRLNLFEGKLGDIMHAAARTRLETRKALAESANVREARFRTILVEVKKEVEGLRLELERERDARIVSDNNFRHDLQKLLEESRQRR
jgi:hypothetical protein